jgi:hypothetical protein
MPRGLFPRSFMVRVVHQPGGTCFKVQDLKTGEVKVFTNWEELKRYLLQFQEQRLR